MTKKKSTPPPAPGTPEEAAAAEALANGGAAVDDLPDDGAENLDDSDTPPPPLGEVMLADKSKPADAPPGLATEKPRFSREERDTIESEARGKRTEAIAVLRRGLQMLQLHDGHRAPFELDAERCETDLILNALISVLCTRGVIDALEVHSVAATLASMEAQIVRERVRTKLNAEIVLPATPKV